MTGGPVLPGEGKTDYERYLRVPQLLRVVRQEGLAHRDEHLFQVVHQTAELWFHQIVWDIDEAEARIKADRPMEAARLVRRMRDIIKIVTEQVHVLETMVVWDYHAIRRSLGRGSGQESPGFNNIIAHAPRMERAYLDLVERRGTTLLELNTSAERHFDLVDLGDSLSDFDLYFHLWRQSHLAFVKRMIGPGQKSLKGYSVEALEKHIVGRFLFPRLLEVRDEMTDHADKTLPGPTGFH